MSNPVDADVPRDLDEDAARALVLAFEEAVLLGHDRVGTEHLLLGLLANESCAAAQALTDAGASLAAARHKVAEAAGPSVATTQAATGRTARATRALNRAVRFSHGRRSEVVTTEHVLLGVLDVEGTAGQVLRRLGIDVQRLRDSLDDAEPEPPAPSGRAGHEDPAPRHVVATLVCPACSMALRDHISIQAVTVDAHIVKVLACTTCGVFLGVAPSFDEGEVSAPRPRARKRPARDV